MKGQYLTIEYVIFFAIGIGMIVAVYFLFSNINSISEKSAIKAQLEITGEMIRGTIINVLEASNLTNSTIYYNLTIPPKLSRCTYAIKVENGLNLNCTGDPTTGVILTLYNFNIDTENIIYSPRSYLQIVAEDGVVELK